MELLNGVLAIVPLWLLWPIVVAIAVYWYLTKDHNYWRDVGIPYVTALPLVGSLGSAFINPLHLVEVERYKTKGQIYGAYEASRPILTVADPEVLRDIFVKDFQFFTGRRQFSMNDSMLEKMVSNLHGEDWKRVRTLITPAFTTGKLKKMTSIFIDSAKTLSENFQKAATEGKPLDMKRFFGAFSMDVIASSAFATKIDSHNDPINPFVTAARKIFNTNFSWRIILFVLYPTIMKIFRISPFVPAPVKFFSDITLRIVQERKRSGQRRNDFLQLLIDAEEELEKSGIEKENDEASEIGHEENNYQVFTPTRSFKLTEREISEEVVHPLILKLTHYWLSGQLGGRIFAYCRSLQHLCIKHLQNFRRKNLRLLPQPSASMRQTPSEFQKPRNFARVQIHTVIRALSNDELVAQCLFFFLAGYDTTASTLSFIMYELALNPDVQEKLITEIDESIREKGELRYETIFEMKYLDCVVSETLRKYPPLIRVERMADEDYEIKKYNVTARKGMVVGVPVYAMHHDPEYYPDPEKYDPERFLPEAKATRPPYAYLPFGAGPRNCIAMRFALTEVKVGIAYVLSQFRFHTCPQTANQFIRTAFDVPRFVLNTVAESEGGMPSIRDRILHLALNYYEGGCGTHGLASMLNPD